MAGSKVSADSNFGTEVAGKQKGTESGSGETWLLGRTGSQGQILISPTAPGRRESPQGLGELLVWLWSVEGSTALRRKESQAWLSGPKEAGARGPSCQDPCLLPGCAVSWNLSLSHWEQLFLTVCFQLWPSYVGPPALQFAKAGTIPVAATTITVGWPSMKPWTWVPPQRHTVKINLATPRPPLPIWHGEVLGGLAVR